MENNETNSNDQDLANSNLYQQNNQPPSPQEYTPPLANDDLASAPSAFSQSFNSPDNAQQNNQFVPEYVPPVTQSQTISQWPGAFGIFKISKEAVKLNLGTIIALLVIPIILSYSVGFASKLLPSNTLFVLNILSSLVNMIISATMTYIIIESVKGQKANIGIALSTVFKKALNVILASIITTTISIVSIILFIIPAFFIIPRISLTLCFIIDKDMGAMEALSASWNNTKGNLGKIYGMIGFYILSCLPAITIIGIIATIYLFIMYSASFALFYMYTINNKPAIN